MFKKISRRIALQFTAFVFLLFMVNGAIFLVADFGNARRQTLFRLERFSETGPGPLQFGRGAPPPGMAPRMRERIRVLDTEGNVVYDGGFFEDVPVTTEPGFSRITVQNEQYAVLTRPVLENGAVKGYVQFADLERQQMGDLPLRIWLYLAVSVGMSALTYAVGISFARRSLQPAQDMMERLEQFTQDASHELRTPLATVNSSLDLAMRNGKLREGILSAKEDLKDVAVLVERLLELARLDSFVLENGMVDLSALVREAAAKLRSSAKDAHVTLETETEQKVTVRGDALLLRQAIGNLLSNAIKFSKPAGGTVRIRLTAEQLSVEDTGIGIPAKDLPHVFDRFYQADTSRARHGFGLGLALVKRVVELHGMSIGVQSKTGKGTKFAIALTH
ncbi:MAG: HAMP domain-containing sensor histidine kinase [Candidatus Peribacteraceae bacterium]|nr:HAMP domain-containing sensor histidine kinase [Candidatus Peribacteraceae bacterium]